MMDLISKLTILKEKQGIIEFVSKLQCLKSVLIHCLNWCELLVFKKGVSVANVKF